MCRRVLRCLLRALFWLCRIGVDLVIPERGGAGVSVKEQQKAPIPEVLRNGMDAPLLDSAFLEQVDLLRAKVSTAGRSELAVPMLAVSSIGSTAISTLSVRRMRDCR